MRKGAGPPKAVSPAARPPTSSPPLPRRLPHGCLPPQPTAKRLLTEPLQAARSNCSRLAWPQVEGGQQLVDHASSAVDSGGSWNTASSLPTKTGIRLSSRQGNTSRAATPTMSVRPSF